MSCTRLASCGRWILLFIWVCPGFSGCWGVQSALSEQGTEAARVLSLLLVMSVGAVLIVSAVLFLVYLALFGGRRSRESMSNERLIVIGGVVFPVVVLSALLVYGFGMLADGPGTGVDAAEPLRIEVVGERWWWRVRYVDGDGSYTESANELRIPTGRPIEVELTSADVIHSFWIPAYAGKVDMIPGRETMLRLEVTVPGVVRGQCAEYCGGAHALMSFYVVALSPEEFAAWLIEEHKDAQVDPGAGLELFTASGCGGCHAIRGTDAGGTIGPDLTHVGRRLSIGAGLLPTGTADFAHWISRHRDLKPGNSMPPYGVLSDDETRVLAEFLSALE